MMATTKLPVFLLQEHGALDNDIGGKVVPGLVALPGPLLADGNQGQGVEEQGPGKVVQEHALKGGIKGGIICEARNPTRQLVPHRLGHAV